MVRRSFRIARRLVVDPAGAGREIVRRLNAAPAQLVLHRVDASDTMERVSRAEAAAYGLRSQLTRAEARLECLTRELAAGRLQATPCSTTGDRYALAAAQVRLLDALHDKQQIVIASQARIADLLNDKRRLEAAEAASGAELTTVAERLRGMELASAEADRAHALACEQLQAELAQERARNERIATDQHALRAAEVSLADARSMHAAQIQTLHTEHASAFERLNDELTRERARNELIATNLLALRTQVTAEIKSFRYAAGTASERMNTLYLDLIEKTLTGEATADPAGDPWSPKSFDPLRRSVGRDWPRSAVTMIGSARMRNLRLLCERALAEGVAGDFIETGVWRGGACIYMRAVLAASDDRTRRVFVADSFQGLPPPDVLSFPDDRGDTHHSYGDLAVTRAAVEANFRKFDLLDERVIFLEGWFRDTLPGAPIEKLAVLRLDGDMYESTFQALDALYNKVSPGGFVIVDDYILAPCARAINDFRAVHGITAPLVDVDGAAVWWQVPSI